MQLLHKDITDKILGSAFEIQKTLGYGYLEKVYQKAMQVELKERGMTAELEIPIKVKYKGYLIGEYYADLLVEGKVLVELKVAKQYNPKDEAQLLNQLKATGYKVGMLINFGEEKAQYKRMVY